MVMRVNVLEVASRYLYPALKRRLAEKLAERGYTQTSIARLLGANQSTISRYLRADRALAELHPALEKEIDVIVEAVAGGVKPDAVQACLINLTILALNRRYACTLHARIDPSVDPSTCNLCPRLFKPVYPDTRSCIERESGG